MIVYLDTSALVKLYFDEPGSLQTVEVVDGAELVGTSQFTRAETAAACARALVLRLIARPRELRDQLAADWPSFVRIALNASIVSRAESLAWDRSLRAAEAVHLASALTWKEGLGLSITLATFDAPLWEASREAGLDVWPNALPRRHPKADSPARATRSKHASARHLLGSHS